MKRSAILVLSIALLVCLTGCSGSRKFKNTTYADVAEMEGISEERLFSYINMWFIYTFKGTVTSINSSDRDTGIIKLTYVFRLPNMEIHEPDLRSNLTVEVQNERYKISFSEAYYQVAGDDENIAKVETYLTSQKAADAVLEQWKNFADDMSQSLIRLFQWQDSQES